MIDPDDADDFRRQEVAKWRRRAVRLWALLEDVAVADDMTEGDDASYRAAARAAAFRRFAVMPTGEYKAWRSFMGDEEGDDEA